MEVVHLLPHTKKTASYNDTLCHSVPDNGQYSLQSFTPSHEGLLDAPPLQPRPP